MGRNTFAEINQSSRYARALESAPELMATLQDRSTQDLDLRHEVGLARMLLEQLLGQLGEFHGKNSTLHPVVFDGVKSMLAQVQGMVSSAAAIEAKRDDQRISATHILTLLVALRDDLKRRLQMAFGDVAAETVDAVFKSARWTGGLREEDVRDALLEPAAFDLRLRVVDREGDALKESAKARSLNSPEMIALAASDETAEAADPLALPPDSDAFQGDQGDTTLENEGSEG